MVSGVASSRTSDGRGTQNWLRERLEELERIERPSASEGERRAAEWLVARFGELGAEARIEAERAHGTYWWPLGIGAALARCGAVAALRGRRLLGPLLGALGAAGDRRRLPARPAAACAASCPSAPPTTSSASSATPRPSAPSSSSPTTTPPTPGSSSTPRSRSSPTASGLIEKTDTSPMLMAPVFGGPLLAALGAAHRPRPARQARARPRRSARSRRWPTSARARSFPAPTTTAPRSSPCSRWPGASSPSRREGVRVILLSVGSEESFSEGIKAFGERHFAELPRESTFFLCLESSARRTCWRCGARAS